MSTKTKKDGFIMQAGILAMAGILCRIIGILYRSPLTGIIGDEGNGYYSSAYNIYVIILLVSSYSIPSAISKVIAEKLALKEYKNAIKFKNEYYNRIEGNTADLLRDYTKYSDESILSLYDAYNKNFQLSLVIGAAVYLLNIIDAMVYGHLYEFNIDDNLSARISPFYLPPTNFTTHNFGINLSIQIK